MYRTTYEGRWGDIRVGRADGIRKLAEEVPLKGWEWAKGDRPKLRCLKPRGEWQIRGDERIVCSSDTEQGLHVEIAEALIKAHHRRAALVRISLTRAGVYDCDYVRAVYDSGVLVELDLIDEPRAKLTEGWRWDGDCSTFMIRHDEPDARAYIVRGTVGSTCDVPVANMQALLTEYEIRKGRGEDV